MNTAPPSAYSTYPVYFPSRNVYGTGKNIADISSRDVFEEWEKTQRMFPALTWYSVSAGLRTWKEKVCTQ